MDTKIVLLCICIVLFGILDAKHNRKYFKYNVKNDIEDPRFSENILMEIKPRRVLIDYMEEACRIAPIRFTNFTATYYPSVPGYFIDAINGVAGNWPQNKTYWQILNKGASLTVGVSEYVPQPMDNILFNLTYYTSEHI